jgi:hypothetical protein
MGKIAIFHRCFGCGDTGAVTIEQVAVTSRSLLPGIAAFYLISISGALILATGSLMGLAGEAQVR